MIWYKCAALQLIQYIQVIPRGDLIKLFFGANGALKILSILIGPNFAIFKPTRVLKI